MFGVVLLVFGSVCVCCFVVLMFCVFDLGCLLCLFVLCFVLCSGLTRTGKRDKQRMGTSLHKSRLGRVFRIYGSLTNSSVAK